MIKVSVIIPVFNARESIRKCLESVLNNDYGNFEVILVDDNSNDGTQAVIGNSIDNRLKIFTEKTNLGPASARNRAIKESIGEIILLLDADSFVGRDWIRRHAQIIEETGADIIGGGIEGVSRTIYGRCDALCSWWTSIPYSRNYYLKGLHLPTNNMSIKKEVFRKIGYFDEGLRWGEDADFCYRALKNGIVMYFRSDLVARHYERDNFKGFLAHQKKWGRQIMTMRKKRKMAYHYLIPQSEFSLYLCLLPLSMLFTLFIIAKWIRYRPSAVFYLPIIFIGKLTQVLAIRDSLKEINRLKIPV